MRRATTVNAALYTLNMALVFTVAALGIWLWLHGHASVGAVAVAAALALRLLGMSHWIMWELSALFENIGTVHDGISSIALPPPVDDAPGAPTLSQVRGEVRFQDVAFHYGKGGGVIEHFDLQIAPGEKIGLVGRSGAGKSTLVLSLIHI